MSTNDIDNGRLSVEPQRRQRYAFDELLAQCGPAAELTEGDRQWLGARPIGKELV